MTCRIVLEDLRSSTCIFCFKSGIDTEKQDFKMVNQFLMILERCRLDGMLFSEINESFQKSCCVECLGILSSFCDIYHQLKCLGLQMEWKLMSLMDIMKSADMTHSFLKAHSKDTIKSLRSFRKLVISKCQKRLSRSLPRVVLKRISPTEKTLHNLEYETEDGLSSNTSIEMDDPCDDYGQDDHENENPLEMDLSNVEQTICDPLGDAALKAVSEQTEQLRHIQVICIKTEDFPGENENFLELGVQKEEDSESFHLEHEDPPSTPSQPNAQSTLQSISLRVQPPSIKIAHVKSIKKHTTPNNKQIHGDKKSSVMGYHCGLCNYQTNTYNNFRLHKRSIRHQTRQKLHLLKQKIIKTEVPREVPEVGDTPPSIPKEFPPSLAFNRGDSTMTPRYSLREKKRYSYKDSMEEAGSDDDNEASDPPFQAKDIPPQYPSNAENSEDEINPAFNTNSKTISPKRCALDGCSGMANTKNHQKLHAPGTFHCHFCEVVEENVLRLSVHELNEHPSNSDDKDPVTHAKRHHCPRCSFETQVLHRYKVHFAAAHIPGFENADKISQANMVWCEICQLNIRKRRSKAHFKVLHDKTGVDPSNIRKYNYEGCPAYFVYRAENYKQVQWQRNSHREKVHRRSRSREGSQRKFLCPEVNCLEMFETHERLEAHKKLHGTFNCSFCDEVKNYAPELAVHESENHAPKCSKTRGPSKPWKKIRKQVCCARCHLRFPDYKKELVDHFVTKHLKLWSLKEKKKCAICNAESRTNHKRFLKMHFIRCHKMEGLDPSVIHRCPLCPAYFIKASQLHQHSMKMHFQKKCSECGISLQSATKMKRHMERDHPDCSAVFDTMPFICDFEQCGRRFGLQSQLTSHQMSHGVQGKRKPGVTEVAKEKKTEEPTKSLQNEPNVDSDETKNKHESSKYTLRATFGGASSASSRSSCGDSERNGNSEDEATLNKVSKEVIEPESKDFDLGTPAVRNSKVCQTVGQKRHVELVHTNCEALFRTKSFKCEFKKCRQAFASETELISHKTQHSNSRRHQKDVILVPGVKCPKCDKEFNKRRLLWIHLKFTHGPHTKLCAVSGKGFNKTARLEKHMEYHKPPEEWKFECSTCGEKFINDHRLRIHARKVHHVGKPFVCQYCGDTYVIGKSLEHHINTKHRDKFGDS